ncbi:type II toxin-antitoxin system RelE/ParE family toxin [Salmonella enterica]|uniref:Type II toxin-antitoxin system RelE/ParE family toxin n=1 Tax=Salmonella enterica TaxID=28901 RepID=A0A750MMT8_SALER|nr:type II toxin-antitoxin system RelE/ParE family toxin [Salmonella enterica]EBU8671768.1 addiction module toxin RelE [Salmonella enterica subsp. enterica serovar Panama]EEE1025196.1 type II toxin-antitoxin system RelE/ParE family toxin [Salmonella enterica subsp. enterica serovar Miami]EIG0951988.1 type II toxin-antitoxin system RelE/ParE family toxin [Salmonella enterica subsp. enterica serovar Muenchen]EAT1859503.1 type II toxin-antitoxin system RelE/ParE family toxin [Salmonella enterica]
MWKVISTELYDQWFDEQDFDLREDMLAAFQILREFGPNLGRPHVDTVKNSDFPNMKELRVQSDGHPVRAFFAFDPERKAVVLCAGDKTGLNEKRFYKEMIKLADAEYRKHLTGE